MYSSQLTARNSDDASSVRTSLRSRRTRHKSAKPPMQAVSRSRTGSDQAMRWARISRAGTPACLRAAK